VSSSCYIADAIRCKKLDNFSEFKGFRHKQSFLLGVLEHFETPPN
jgi:hypothetical protein